MHRAIMICLAVLAGPGALSPAAALDYEVEGTTLYLEGEIHTRDLPKMRRALQRNPDLRKVVLWDVPGSNDDETNAKIIRLFRAAGLNTHLEADSFMASGGTDLFLSGVERSVDRGAQIGVHSWSDGVREGRDFPRNSGEHSSYLALYAELGIPEDFYWFTLKAAPADGMHFMSETEIERFGLVTRPIGTGASE